MDKRELYETICELFGEADNVEQLDYVEFEDVKYTYRTEEELDTVSEGKYEYGGTVYAVGIMNDDFNIESPLFFMEQSFTRSGSYFSDYYYEFDAPTMVVPKEVTKTIWVQA